jgi:putative hydrolase of the HAD superfamily
MTMRPQAVGFDLDYTLWDQGPFADSFFAAIAGELGGRLGFRREVVLQAFQGALVRLSLQHPNLFGEALAELGVRDPALVAELVARYRRHRPPAVAYPGATETLHHLEAAGYPLFLVTDGHSASQRHKVEALGIGGCFRHMVFTGDLPADLHKPSPIPFLLACGRLGVEPCRCIYVADNPLCDFQGPRRLGMLTIGVPTGPFAAMGVGPGQRPDLRIGSLSELRGML